MNGKRTHFLLAGLALSLAMSPLAAMAEDASKPVKIDETKSHERGVMWTPMGTPSAGTAPAISTPTISKPEIKSAIQAVTHPAVKKVVKPVSKSAHATSKPAAATTAKVKSPASVAKVSQPKAESNGSKEDTAMASQSSSALVKFGQDGPVVTASLDHNGDSPKYKVGDKMVINVKAHQDCNLVVFNYDSTGTLTQLYPNDYDTNGFVKSGENVEIGGDRSSFSYQIGGNGGPEKIFVYAYPSNAEKPSAMQTIAMNPVAGTPFRSTEMSVDQYRKLINECGNFGTRSVKVVAKRAHQLVGYNNPSTANSANKIELSFVVEK